MSIEVQEFEQRSKILNDFIEQIQSIPKRGRRKWIEGLRSDIDWCGKENVKENVLTEIHNEATVFSKLHLCLIHNKPDETLWQNMMNDEGNYQHKKRWYKKIVEWKEQQENKQVESIEEQQEQTIQEIPDDRTTENPTEHWKELLGSCLTIIGLLVALIFYDNATQWVNFLLMLITSIVLIVFVIFAYKTIHTIKNKVSRFASVLISLSIIALIVIIFFNFLNNSTLTH